MEQYINKIINADCLDVLRQLPDKCVDLVLTDPPYNASNSKIVCEEKSFNAVNEDWDKGFVAKDFLVAKDWNRHNDSRCYFKKK